MDITKLKGHIPDSVYEQLPDTIKKFNINTTLRLSHFLSQCSHESGEFKVTKENLNYSAKRLKEIFPKYFPGDTSNAYANNPEKIANKVYGGRMGNGDEKSGDGYKYCGRGFLQTTGKSNYTLFDKLVEEDILVLPGLVGTKYPLLSAAFFFENNKLWTICDLGSDEITITKLTKRINGGTIGILDRMKQFNIFFKILS